MKVLLAALTGYVLGSVLSADVVSRLGAARNGAAVDLRATGSGNPGAANAFSSLGKGWAAAILVGDMLKGAIASLLGWSIAGPTGAFAAGTTTVVGHCYPVTKPRKGGKGVATSVGTTLVLFPVYVPVDVAIAAATWLRWKHAGGAAMTASGLFVASSAAWALFRLPNAWGPNPRRGLVPFAVVTSAAIASRFAMVNRTARDDELHRAVPERAAP